MKHGRLIDADALIGKYGDWYTEEGTEEGYIGTIKGIVDSMPTIEPERKPGKWIDAEWENINSGEKRKGRRCSVCGHGYFRYDVSVNTVSDIPNFCPNCGADMRGEQNENN